jgi:hypothetical protein
MRLFIVFILLFVFSIIDSTLLSVEKVDYRIVRYVASTNIAIFIFQILLLLSVKKIIKNNKIFIITISIIAAINILAFKLAYYSFFVQLKDVYQFVILLALSKALFELFKYVETSKTVFGALIIILSALLIVPLASFSEYDINYNSHQVDSQQVKGWGGEHRDFANKIIDVKFVKKPNIHIITFDSLMPEELVRKYFSIQDKPSYIKTIEDNNGVVYKNSFSMHVPTQRAWSSFLMLDQTRFEVDHRRFNGRKDSILFNIFRSNGYKILTGYPGSYFGVDKGDYIDIYDTFSEESGVLDSVYCLMSDKASKDTIAFFIDKHYDICNSDLYNPLRNYFVKDFGKPLLSPGQEVHLTYDLQMGFQDKAIKNIEMTELTNSPWVTAHHFQTIGHVGSSFVTYDKSELKKYIDNYKRKMLIVSEYIEKILKAAGSDSIVLIMGDHGSYISTSLKGYDNLTKDEKSFFVQDRHGVLTALFGVSNACDKKLVPYYSWKKHGENISYAKDPLPSDIKGGFTSSARVISGVVRCLSDQPDKFDKALTFTNPQNFNDFLYE